MNEKLNVLINQLKETRERYGCFLQDAASSNDVEILNNIVREKFNIELSPVYKYIVLKTNGVNENGVFLYGTETNLLKGYSDIYLEGLIDSNEGWHDNDDFSHYLFYADSDCYLFAQSLKTKLYSCRVRDSFERIIFETNNDNEFFEKIFQLAFDEDALE